MDGFDFMDFNGGEDAAMPYQNGAYLPEASDCMRCGACLNSCPTYQLTQDEQEGPRQRVRSLVQLVQQQQALDDDAIQHLHNCIQCRACEAVCPSQMSYSEFYEQARQELYDPSTASRWARLGLYLIASKSRIGKLLPWIKFYQRSGLQAILGNTGILNFLGLQRAARYLTDPSCTALLTRYPVINAVGTVALFTGCMTEAFDRKTLNDAIRTLNACGYSVLVPPQQQCCGAMHYHNGSRQTAEKLMQQNIEEFNQWQVEAVIYCATGCGSMLNEYPRIFEQHQPEHKFNAKLVEISEFLNQHWPATLRLNDYAKTVVIHEACSQRNVLKNASSMYQLLEKIPQCTLLELTENQLCCGAGGTYMLSHPWQADALRDRKMHHAKVSDADVLITANIGCAMHLSNVEEPIEIMHPVSLLAKCLQ